ncbi:MAG TPA: PaaI family thioesterase [Gammaproteobacteria bacterium]|nr:PaaI family thioesterase [Gammaproteobacteria bacterium]
MSPGELEAAIEGVAAVPLHRHLGLEIIAVEQGRSRTRLSVGAGSLNNKQVLHGGVVYALLDATAYLSILPLLDDGENAVTHDLFVSVMRGVSSGEVLELGGSVLRRGRSLVFAESEARVGNRLVATARVTKSVVRER